MNWITLIASIYHWDSKVDNEIIIMIDQEIKDYIRLKGGE